MRKARQESQPFRPAVDFRGCYPAPDRASGAFSCRKLATKRRLPQRVPPPAGSLQVNFCRNPACDNFGRPPGNSQGGFKTATDEPPCVMSGGGSLPPTAICNDNGKHLCACIGRNARTGGVRHAAHPAIRQVRSLYIQPSIRLLSWMTERAVSSRDAHANARGRSKPLIRRPGE